MIKYFLLLFVILNHHHSYAKNDKNTSKFPCSCGKSLKKNAILASVHKKTPKGMVEIPAGTFMMGGHDSQAKLDELPLHEVKLDSFYMDETEITNAQFEVFVEKTHFTTIAEKPVDWELLKKQLPPDTPKPSPEVLAPGSLVFSPPDHAINLNDPSQWWLWVNGASWRHPLGPNSQILGNDHPVVHISWEDANAYCQWKGKRLPTEAEREWAARGGLENKMYPWGDEDVDLGVIKTNIWQGAFPHQSTKKNYWTTPVKTYSPNGYGLYDMAGNVWEWTADFYDANYYSSLEKQGIAVNPHNVEKSFDPDEPNVKKYVLRGGSFLCHKSYCMGYRVSARMKTSPDTALGNVGFRCVQDKKSIH
ncbi:MAG: formylglycine-generating enzyme family protein [Alphaproteobacteria bacterium]|nr:formylglycine-generating enzyme family protein [Alphaproteobacteria bacterium]MBP9777155.1 formylglycine-generating enzyme family protein [Alphaproteobacteria bacterium]